MAENHKLVVRSLVKHYRDGARTIEVLTGVDLSVCEGELVGVVGRSGAGKSTLLHLLGLLDTPTSGQILLDGKPAGSMTAAQRAKARRDVFGFVFQAYHLMPDLNVLENVTIPTMIAGPVAWWRTRKDAKKRALELLDRVGLADRARFKVAKLSGGERQRVAIARALINQPEILLMDEPTGNLDERTGRDIQELIIELRASLALTALIVTHDVSLVALSDRVLHLEAGKLRKATS